jgi:acetamidase/formamidase
MRGANGVGDGVHIMTGPIYVCGAEPGDVLEVQIVDLKPRPNPSTGKTYGSNAAAWVSCILLLIENAVKL